MSQIIFGIVALLVGCCMTAFYKRVAQLILDFWGWHGKYDKLSMAMLTLACGVAFILFALLLLFSDIR